MGGGKAFRIGFLSLILLLCVYMCACVHVCALAHAMAHMYLWKSEDNFQELI